jgi:hypothetical protein
MRFAKPEYTETEAAEELGLSVDQLRAMIRAHILQEDEALGNLSKTAFQRSDLVIMRLLLAACRFD